MSLQHAAQHLAAHGRGPDTELIHMTKGEIAGLQALAKANGGSLTVNPHTGLPEAGFLESLLPMALGAGITAMTGGAAAPWMIGLGMGGLETLRTGNLMKGLTAGLGAYGGAGLAGSLASLGTSEAATAVGNSATQAGEKAAQEAIAEQAAKQAAEQQAINAAGQSAMSPQAIESVASRQMQLNALAPEAFGESAREAAANAYMPTATQTAAMNSPISTGISAAIDSPSKLVAATGGSNLAKMGLMAAAPAISDAMTPNRTGVAAVQGDSSMGPRYRFEPGVANPFPQASSTGTEQNYYPNQKYTRLSDADAKALYGYADGGMAYGQGDDQGDPNLMQVKTYDPVVRMAGGGISDLGSYSDGGRLLKGPGDGVSDSIPAEIGGKQPARLADGEFVVPARIVSELGNGSTDAGARQLYKMMDRVQQARGKTTAKGKMAKNTNAAKYLPA